MQIPNRTLLILVLFVTLFFASPAFAGNYVYGKVKYSDGSKCGKCRVSAATRNGVTKNTFTDSSGNYRLKTADSVVKKIYISGKTQWEGSKNSSGGVKIDVTIR